MRVIAAAESGLYKINKESEKMKRIKVENKIKRENSRGNHGNKNEMNELNADESAES